MTLRFSKPTHRYFCDDAVSCLLPYLELLKTGSPKRVPETTLVLDLIDEIQESVFSSNATFQ